MHSHSPPPLHQNGAPAGSRNVSGGGHPAPPRPDRPHHDARLLTAGGVEAEIRLDGVRYVLRITRQGKLILTK